MSIIEAGSVLKHGRERLGACLEPSPPTTGPPVSTSRYNAWRAFGLYRVPLTIARAALRQGFDRIALRASRAAANAKPQSARANIVCGIACRRANDTASALFYLRQAAANDDPSKKGNWEYAKLLLRVMRETTADEICPELLAALREARQSSDPAVRRGASLALSNAFYERGDYEAAQAAADAVLCGIPDDTRALRAKANSMAAQNRFAEAAALYRRVLADDTGNAEIARKLQLLTNLAQETPQAVSSSSAIPLMQSTEPLLIGIGSGIGDILHATPMIRNIARRTGRLVEVVVAADHPDAQFLADNPLYVSRVWPVSRAVLERSYKTVFLTHFFGPMRFAFRAERVLASAEWRRFRVGMLNDTLLNLEAAKHLLGIPYGDSDVDHYFVGELSWRPPAESLIGIHAGSKAGRWLSKRWPHFPELARRLLERGIRVASFGTPDEYVSGTENRTGGTIEEMSRSMLACSHFVSNDSGAMHIASALGIPVMALYAPTDALSHLPLRSSTAALALDKPCSPCEVKDHRHFASGACRCIGEITVDVVEANIIEMLARRACYPDQRVAGIAERAT